MIKKIFLTLFLINLSTQFAHPNEINCDDFKKFSVNRMKCKADLMKKKTISVGKNFIKDTKDYQKKEWSEEKKKINDIKKKF